MNKNTNEEKLRIISQKYIRDGADPGYEGCLFIEDVKEVLEMYKQEKFEKQLEDKDSKIAEYHDAYEGMKHKVYFLEDELRKTLEEIITEIDKNGELMIVVKQLAQCQQHNFQSCPCHVMAEQTLESW